MQRVERVFLREFSRRRLAANVSTYERSGVGEYHVQSRDVVRPFGDMIASDVCMRFDIGDDVATIEEKVTRFFRDAPSFRTRRFLGHLIRSSRHGLLRQSYTGFLSLPPQFGGLPRSASLIWRSVQTSG